MDAPVVTINRTAEEKFCTACGSKIHVLAEICPRCGVRQMPPPMMPQPQQQMAPVVAPNGKNRVAAALLAILLGSLGVHKFYLGQVGMGILYLLFFWTAIPGLVGLIEGIVLLTMSDEQFVYKHGYQ
jgi:TM2 domain-containing membrane protein YozV